MDDITYILCITLNYVTETFSWPYRIQSLGVDPCRATFVTTRICVFMSFVLQAIMWITSRRFLKWKDQPRRRKKVARQAASIWDHSSKKSVGVTWSEEETWRIILNRWWLAMSICFWSNQKCCQIYDSSAVRAESQIGLSLNWRIPFFR